MTASEGIIVNTHPRGKGGPSVNGSITTTHPQIELPNCIMHICSCHNHISERSERKHIQAFSPWLD